MSCRARVTGEADEEADEDPTGGLRRMDARSTLPGRDTGHRGPGESEEKTRTLSPPPSRGFTWGTV